MRLETDVWMVTQGFCRSVVWQSKGETYSLWLLVTASKSLLINTLWGPGSTNKWKQGETTECNIYCGDSHLDTGQWSHGKNKSSTHTLTSTKTMTMMKTTAPANQGKGLGTKQTSEVTTRSRWQTSELVAAKGVFLRPHKQVGGYVTEIVDGTSNNRHFGSLFWAASSFLLHRRSRETCWSS